MLHVQAVAVLRQMHRDKTKVNSLDADKGHNNSAHAVNQQVPPQQARCIHRTVFHAAQSQRHQCDDDHLDAGEYFFAEIVFHGDVLFFICYFDSAFVG